MAAGGVGGETGHTGTATTAGAATIAGAGPNAGAGSYAGAAKVGISAVYGHWAEAVEARVKTTITAAESFIVFSCGKQ